MAGIIQDLGTVFQGVRSWLSFLPRISVANFIEIVIIAVLVYYALL